MADSLPNVSFDGGLTWWPQGGVISANELYLASLPKDVIAPVRIVNAPTNQLPEVVRVDTNVDVPLTGAYTQVPGVNVSVPLNTTNVPVSSGPLSFLSGQPQITIPGTSIQIGEYTAMAIIGVVMVGFMMSGGRGRYGK